MISGSPEFSPKRTGAPVWQPRPPAGYKPRPRHRRLILRADELARLVADAVAHALRTAGPTRDTGESAAAAKTARVASPALLSPRQVGERISRSAEWVREHRGEFEQVRLSEGEKPRLLFTAASVDAWLERQTVKPSRAPVEASPPRRRRRSRTDAELLPIRR